MNPKNFIDYEESSDLLQNPVALRERLSRNGYLFFKNLVDAGKVDKVRHGIYSIFKKYGLVDRNSSQEGKWTGKKIDASSLLCDGEIGMQISKLRSIRELYNTEEIIGVQKKVFDGEVFPWVENVDRVRAYLPGISRMMVAGQLASTATMAHQDHFPFRNKKGGKDTFNTTWVPLMDIDESVGGLTLMKNSHLKGFHKHFIKKGDVKGVASSIEEMSEWKSSGYVPAVGESDPDKKVEWLRSNYHSGDVLIFSRLTVHGGCPNTSDKIRLSTDFRYQRKGTYTSWKSFHRLPWTLKFGSEIRRTINELGIKDELGDRVWETMHNIQGPSMVKGNTIESRILEVAKTL
tara:strand:- start:597 stop:1637 length:1041 start_codon:yes stop_codon:yes gene_type:complete